MPKHFIGTMVATNHPAPCLNFFIMNRVSLVFLFIVFLFLYFHPAQAQRKWKKALPARNAVSYNNGKFNIGLKAGAIWSYFGYSSFKNTTYEGIIGPMAGLLLEYKTNQLSVGFNPFVAIRGTAMHYDKVWQTGLGQNQTAITRSEYVSQMNIVGTRIPFTYYFNSFFFSNPKDRQIFATLAPEACYVLGGKIRYAKFKMPDHTLIPDSDASVDIGDANMQRFQYGIACGAGLSSRHNINAFTFVMRYELAFCCGINNTFSEVETEGNFPPNGGFGGSPYATVQKGQRRYRALDFSVTVMFPIKKQLRGACINWGEYN